jgi:hypothetical protein
VGDDVVDLPGDPFAFPDGDGLLGAGEPSGTFLQPYATTNGNPAIPTEAGARSSRTSADTTTPTAVADMATSRPTGGANSATV